MLECPDEPARGSQGASRGQKAGADSREGGGCLSLRDFPDDTNIALDIRSKRIVLPTMHAADVKTPNDENKKSPG